MDTSRNWSRIIGLDLLHHNDLYRPMIEDGFDKLKRKLAGNKLQALVPYLTSK